VRFRRADDEAGAEIEARLEVLPPTPERIYDMFSGRADGPTQTIRLDPYFISKYEVTQGQWVRWTGGNPSGRAAGSGSNMRLYTADQPVESMSWEDATEFCRQLGLQLPSDAQWEVACRAGTLTPWFTGESMESIDGYANILDSTVKLAGVGWEGVADWLEDGFARTAPVGSFDPNPFGLHDIIGNVWEWSYDAGIKYTEVKYPARPGDGRRRPVAGWTKRSMRGGSCENDVYGTRSSYRWDFRKSGAPDVGLRPVRMLDGWTPPE